MRPYAKDATRKVLELINEFGKVAGYKINTHRNLPHFYTPSTKDKRKQGNNPI